VSCFTRSRHLRGALACLMTSFAVVGCGGSQGVQSLPGAPGLSETQPSKNDAQTRITKNAALAHSITTTAYQKLVQNDAPSAYYTMADTSSVLADAGPSKLNGSYGAQVKLGAQTFAARSGPAPIFPGGPYAAPSVALVPAATALQPTQLTLEAWVTPSIANTSGQFTPLVSYGSENAGNPYILQITPWNALNFWSRTKAGSAQVQGQTILAAGSTYHVVVTQTATALSLYLNGKLEASGRGNGPPLYAYLAGLGLTIGSAAGSTNRAVFAGAIDDVALYPAILSTGDISAHYLAGTAAPAVAKFTNELPRSADSFVDSFGVNLHLHYQGSPYDVSFAAVKSLLVALGVRHIRDGLYADSWQPYRDRLEQLAQAGIHSTLITAQGETPDIVAKYASLVPGSMEAVEGYNEPDLWNDPNWVAKTTAWQQQLYQGVKGNAATASLTVLGPAVTTSTAAAQIGNLSQWMDAGNVHIYWAGHNPETNGWGNPSPWGFYGSLAFNLGYGTIMSGSLPERVSETGFGTANQAQGVSRATQAKYLARAYFSYFQKNVPWTATYELLDGNDGAFGAYGLVDYNLNPKPAYTEMKSLMGLLSDPGGTSTTMAEFGYQLSGATSNVQHVLLQKKDGKRFLVLWLALPSCNPNVSGACADQAVPAQSVAVATQASASAASVYTFDSSGNMINTVLPMSNGSATVSVTDQVSVVELDP